MLNIKYTTKDEEVKGRTLRFFELYERTMHAGTVVHAEATELIKLGIDVRARDSEYEERPMHICAREGNEEGVKALLEAQAKPRVKDVSGYTPLHSAVVNGHLSCARLLVKADASLLTARSHHLETPTHKAAWAQQADCLYFLLESGAVTHARNDDYETPLHRWVERFDGDDACLKVLLEFGVDINQRNRGGGTALHCLPRSDQPEIIPILLQHGANLYARNNNDQTVMHSAALWGLPRCIKVMADLGMDTHACDNKGNTPLHLCTSSATAANALLALGANVWARNKDGKLPGGGTSGIDSYRNQWKQSLDNMRGPLKTVQDIMALVSVMPPENPHAILRPRELAERLFRTLPHNDHFNDLYQQCTGKPRPLQPTATLQDLRRNASRQISH